MTDSDPKDLVVIDAQLIPAQENLPPDLVEDDFSNYGEYLKKSGACPVCYNNNHMLINLARAKDLKSMTEISAQTGITVEALEKHFRNHFRISKQSRRMLNLRENDTQEANDLIDAIMEGNLDLYSGIDGVLKTKAQRLNIIKERIRLLSDRQECDLEEQIDTAELLQLHKAANDIEDSITKTYQILNKSFLSMRKSDINEAFLKFQLEILNKILNDMQSVLLEFENNIAYKDIIGELRQVLAKRLNIMEELILKSGGIISNLSKS